jgi:hypothetical protein
MQLTEALEPQQQAAELILPAKHALDGIKAFFEYVSIEQQFPATLGGFRLWCKLSNSVVSPRLSFRTRSISLLIQLYYSVAHRVVSWPS